MSELTIDLVHGLYLTVAPDPHLDRPDNWIAIISDGTPHLGHNPVRIMSVQSFASTDDAEAWFEWAKIAQPWNKRN